LLILCGQGLAAGCADSASPASNHYAISFRYADTASAPFAIQSDSALFTVFVYPIGIRWDLLARAYIPDQSTPIDVKSFELTWDSIGQATVPLGTYPLGATPPFISFMMGANEFYRAAADSGTITVTRSDGMVLEGNVSARFTYIQFPSGPPPPFRLTGSFLFQYTDSAPPPP